MFGSLGVWEIVFIVLVGLLIFGPRKLPEISRTVGRALGELRRSAEDFRRTVEREAMDLERTVKPVSRSKDGNRETDPEPAPSDQGDAEDPD